MYICVLGTAAGGGVPQWNCRCENCNDAWKAGAEHLRRSQDSIAISSSRKEWTLLNASPDITRQIERFTCLQPRSSRVRSTPIASVFLTDAELDHTVGLLSMRQSARMDVYAPNVVLKALASDFPLRHIIGAYADYRWKQVPQTSSVSVDNDRLKVTMIACGSKMPRYATTKSSQFATVAYHVEDSASGTTLLYAPSVQHWSDELNQACRNSTCVMVDGTFWSDDELVRMGISESRAADMGHLALSGPGGILEKLGGATGSKHRFLTHLNNTNRILRNGHSLHEHNVTLAPEGQEIVL